MGKIEGKTMKKEKEKTSEPYKTHCKVVLTFETIVKTVLSC